MNTEESKLESQQEQLDIPVVVGSFYNYPTLIEPIYNGNYGTVVKDYRVVGQDSSFPHPLFYGTYDECIKWQSQNCL